ncbi:hypothetical protein JIN86_09550 [Lysinibacillus sp. HST-98]|uniref:hypothetical protein n=1 Tax=Lysinibacillus TaxID=400634 RepID=UPI0001DA4E97|nr:MULTISPECIES: hypothetical protein [Lysinibacillus]EFI68286.1 hypothetical protein BFZC1_12768 [Lysinibacillus fusiformis ZC1]MBL3729845.1 hypothetical protein [Lysinibacillus sp. HST-98]MBU5251492.1 hypothetical protein [Lysinibacillus capsici]MED4700033.1 hypothetical protein [Lysinibacillus capsici]
MNEIVAMTTAGDTCYEHPLFCHGPISTTYVDTYNTLLSVACKMKLQLAEVLFVMPGKRAF